MSDNKPPMTVWLETIDEDGCGMWFDDTTSPELAAAGPYVHLEQFMEELVELPAKAKAYDGWHEGFEDAYVVTSVSGRSVSIDFTEPRAWALAERLEGIFRCDLESSGYTCRKVRVCREVEE